MADTPEAIAYQEALRSITQQQAVLAGLYTRASLVLSAAAVSAAFLGDQAFTEGGLGCWGPLDKMTQEPIE